MNFMKYAILSTLLLTPLLSHGAYEAHEWGTFTSLVGSNGITQNGMYHEDEPLPQFVHPFGELRAERPPIFPTDPEPDRPCRGKMCLFDNSIFQNNAITQKMETPVIYFYTDQNMSVDVNVRFPEGVITDTYPGPVRTYPTREDLTTIANGNTTFSVNVSKNKVGSLNHVDPSNIYSHARAVDSNIVSSGVETEKFIFYRGIGRFQPKLKISSKGESLKFESPKNYAPQATFLVHVNESGHGQILNLGKFAGSLRKSVSASTIKKLMNHDGDSGKAIVSGEQGKGMLVDALVDSGLYKDEAVAMINTWEHGYLKVPGLRLLYILPSHEADEILPLKMTPAPSKLVRSFVGRIEILLEAEEQRLLSRIVEEGNSFKTTSLGRFAEPMLRRVSQVYEEGSKKDPQVTNLIQDLVSQASLLDVGATAIQ